jgi:hypothetical protein
MNRNLVGSILGLLILFQSVDKHMAPTDNSSKLQFIWPSGFGGEVLNKSANQKQELPMAAMFVNESGQN